MKSELSSSWGLVRAKFPTAQVPVSALPRKEVILSGLSGDEKAAER